MTRDDIIRMAREAGWTGPEENVTYVAMLDRFANLIAEAEREACAKVCDELSDEDGFEGGYANRCAFAIRERGAP